MMQYKIVLFFLFYFCNDKQFTMVTHHCLISNSCYGNYVIHGDGNFSPQQIKGLHLPGMSHFHYNNYIVDRSRRLMRRVCVA